MPQLITVAGDTIKTNFPADRIGEMIDLAQGIDGAKVTQVVLDRPYSHSYTNASGIYTLELYMDKLAELSIKVFGTESTYAQP